MDRLSIALADDHKLVTESLKDFLLKNLRCDIVFIAENGIDLLQKFSEIPADIIILDINMPGMDGLEALKIIRSQKADQKIIVLSMYNDEGLLGKLVNMKVNGFLSKTGSAEELLKAVREVRKKGYYHSERFMNIMFNQHFNGEKEGETEEVYPDFDEIDKRIIGLLCEEKNSKEISEEIGMSPRGIEGRRKRLMLKAGVKNLAGLIVYAVKHGLVKL